MMVVDNAQMRLGRGGGMTVMERLQSGSTCDRNQRPRMMLMETSVYGGVALNKEKRRGWCWCW